MKRIEEVIRGMVERDILEEWFICENCDVVKPLLSSDMYTLEDSCPMEDDDLCPKKVLWNNSKEVAEAILNLDCVKQNKILFTALDKEIEQSTTESKRRCRVCGCTDDDCHHCIEKTGKPCYWVEDDLCSACAGK
jgi:hypothetical protein